MLRRVPLIYLYIILISVLLSFQSQAQTISPSTQNIGGTLGAQNSFTLTFSVGEMISTTNFRGADNSTLSSGFLQSYSPLVTAINELHFTEGVSITLSPNPTTNNIKLRMGLLKPGFIQIKIFDNNMNHKTTTYSMFYSNSFEKDFNVDSYAAGVYYLQILFQGADGIPKKSSYKFIKL